MSSRGAALLLTLIVMAVLSALGLGLVLTTASERLTGSNFSDSLDASNAADGALELAVSELALIDDWSPVLSGARQSRFVDGLPDGTRTILDRSINLTTLTNQISCGRDTTCSDAQIRVNTVERPWGGSNPRWRSFLYGRFSQWVTTPLVGADTYVVVWVGDDARETDGDPARDGGGVDGSGRDIVRVRADAFGGGGTRRSVEADVARLCSESSGVRTCEPGIHVQSWRLKSSGVP
jgi:hypothetical protein